MTIFYVNYLIILASKIIQWKWLKLELKREFEMNDLRELHYCQIVEFEMDREARIIFINQMNYIEEVLKCFNIGKCKLVGIPFDANSKLLKL